MIYLAAQAGIGAVDFAVVAGVVAAAPGAVAPHAPPVAAAAVLVAAFSPGAGIVGSGLSLINSPAVYSASSGVMTFLNSLLT